MSYGANSGQVVPASSTVELFFTTNDAAGGAVAPLSAFEAGDVLLYKDHTATPRSSTSGWTMTSPFNSITGLHQLSIDLSDNTDSGFYAVGHVYTAVLSPDTETVDGQTVVSVIGQFSIGVVPASIAAGDLAANSVTASALATDAVTEIVSGLLNTVNTGATFNVNNSIGKQIRIAAGYVFSIRTGTLQSGSTSTTAKLDSGASSTNNIYSGATLAITGGTGVGQSRRVVTYVGSTKVATVDKPWVTTPDNTSTFELQAGSGSLISNEGTLASATGTTAVLASTASTVDDTYNGGLITILAGTGSGQTREITDYTGSTKTVTVATWGVTPDNTSVYAVIPGGGAVSDASPSGPTADEIWAKAMTELSSVPSIDASALEALTWLFTLARNKRTQTASTETVFKDDGSTTLAQSTKSDSGTEFVRGEFA